MGKSNILQLGYALDDFDEAGEKAHIIARKSLPKKNKLQEWILITTDVPENAYAVTTIAAGQSNQNNPEGYAETALRAVAEYRASGTNFPPQDIMEQVLEGVVREIIKLELDAGVVSYESLTNQYIPRFRRQIFGVHPFFLKDVAEGVIKMRHPR